MAIQHRIDPRVRAYGKARIDITMRAKDEQDWQSKWKDPRYPFPFTFGDSWKHCVEYRVDDFAAEVGFFMDVLGFPAQTFSPSFAIFTTPGQDFSISVVAATDGYFSTPPDAIRLQFMVEDILQTAEELVSRGVNFEQLPERNNTGGLITGYFRTPHGICVDLLGYDRPIQRPASRPQPAASNRRQERESTIDEDELEDMPLFTSPIEPDDPLFQFPKRRDEPEDDQNSNLSTGSSTEKEVENNEPTGPTRYSKTPRLPTHDLNWRKERSNQPSRPDPFRRNNGGLTPLGTRRSRYSINFQSASSQYGSTPDKDQSVEESKTPRKANGTGSSRKQKQARSSRNHDSKPIDNPPPTPDAPSEVEPEQELHYEDLNESEDYDLPY